MSYFLRGNASGIGADGDGVQRQVACQYISAFPIRLLVVLYYNQCYHTTHLYYCTTTSVTTQHICSIVLHPALPHNTLVVLYYTQCYHTTHLYYCTTTSVTTQHTCSIVLQPVLPHSPQFTWNFAMSSPSVETLTVVWCELI